VPPVPTRTNKSAHIYLPEYCPVLVGRLNENPRYLNEYRDKAQDDFADELTQYLKLGIHMVQTNRSCLTFVYCYLFVE
jgi:hypothetical protein